ncbi:MAG: hypothetical protein Ct9H300mP5_5160 [Candidatus Pelagibacterales bacterium]|nr:MAG: hypothetical protein Ct9H300mP5_5160 [Pelagibacterales bacterium]
MIEAEEYGINSGNADASKTSKKPTNQKTCWC